MTGTQNQKTWLFPSVRLVSSLTLLSRILGLIRDMAMAALFGNGMILDAFTVAFRIPNLARRVFGEGALSTAFIPVFQREAEQSGRAAAWRVASAVFTLLAVVLSTLVLLGEFVLFLVTRFVHCGAEASLLLGLTAVMLPYLVLICLAAQISAVLHALGHFKWPAMLPVFLNVGWIAAVRWLAPRFLTPQSQVYALAVTIVSLGCVQLLAPWPTLKRFGFTYVFDWHAAKEQVAEIVHTMLPIVVGLSITQLNTLCDSLIAWSFSQPESLAAAGGSGGGGIYPLEAGTASALYFGQRLYQFPLGIFGVALGTVLFPLLSQHVSRGQIRELRNDLGLGMRLVLVVGLPASAGLVLLAKPITLLLFRHGAFDLADANQTSQMVAAYGIGVWAYCGLLIIHRGLYALGDRMAPVRIGMVVVLLNFVLNLTLIWFLGGMGLALSTSICATVQVGVVGWCLHQRVGEIGWGAVTSVFLRALVATLAMSVACLVSLTLLPDESSLLCRFLRVAVPLAFAVATYLVAARALRLDEFWLLLRRNSS